MSVDQRDEFMEDLRESIDELDRLHCSHESRSYPLDVMFWMFWGLVLTVGVLYSKKAFDGMMVSEL